MKFNRLSLIALIVASGMAALPAKAGVIDLRTVAGTVEILPTGGIGSKIDINTSSTDTLASGQPSASLQSNVSNPGQLYKGTGTLQGGTVDAAASVNIETGVSAASVFATPIGEWGQNSTSGFGEANFNQTFNVSGSGYVTISFAVAGGFDLQTTAYGTRHPVVGFQAQSRIRLNRGTVGAAIGLDSFGYNPNNAGCASPTSCTGTINELLSFTSFVSELTSPQVTLYSFMLSQTLTGNGFVDQVGTLSMTTSSGLTLTPTDARFLTKTASVPEPATLALFGFGLAGLGFARRRRCA